MKRPWRFIRGWNELGNGEYGDCTVAAYYHCLMALNVLSGSTFKKILWAVGFPLPKTPFVVADYAAFLATLNEKPAPEQGVDAGQYLQWKKDRGEVLEYRVLSYMNGQLSEAVLHQALDDFGCVMLGGEMTDFSYRSMPNPWYLRPGDSPDPSLGHEVAFLDYNAKVDRVVTWGHWQAMTFAYRQVCFNYACVFVHKDDPQAQVKLAKLASL